jgi:hypothetical protein
VTLFRFVDMASAENYVEVTLKLLDAPPHHTAGKNCIVMMVPRSQIDNHRSEHEAQEAVTDELIALGLAEMRVPDISANRIEGSKFLPERPPTIEGRTPDYDRDGFKGWIFDEPMAS